MSVCGHSAHCRGLLLNRQSSWPGQLDSPFRGQFRNWKAVRWVCRRTGNPYTQLVLGCNFGRYPSLNKPLLHCLLADFFQKNGAKGPQMLCKKKWVPSVPSIFQLLEPVTGLSLVFVQQGRPVGWDSRNYRRGEGSELAKSNWGVHFGHSPPEQAKMDQNGRPWRTLHGSSCVPGVSYVFLDAA